jgi:hypothetical protein
MAIRLNHTIVAAHDKEQAAKFLTEILGLSAPLLVGPFAMVRVSDDTSLDYHDAEDKITSQHYAFLVDENEFDQIFARIRDRHLTYWADPYRHKRDEINTWDLLRRPQRPPAGGHHPSVRQRWDDDIPASPFVRAVTGFRRSRLQSWLLKRKIKPLILGLGLRSCK